jgi:L-alanine-DL-glutamate epimerase-like enolase superfamily enzyme
MRSPRLTLQVERRTLTLRTPLRTSYGEVHERELLLVALVGEDGVTGWGEAAPLQAYDGVGVEETLQALLRHKEAIEAAGDARGGTLLDVARSADPLPQALAAIDLALWDRAGRRAGRPVAELLAGDPTLAVEVNATIGALDRAGAAQAALAAREAGFRCVKVKVGVGDDAGRVAAVRAAAGPQMALRLDANGAWTVEQAIRTIDALAPAGLELVEEPVHGLEGVRAVREQVPVRIAIDETAAEPGALGAGVADAVCLKISRCGGISGLLAAATLVRAGGAEPYLASTFDGPLGIAAAVHAAAALAARQPLPACGLATLDELLGVPAAAADTLRPVRGEIRLPPGPGLGVDP